MSRTVAVSEELYKIVAGFTAEDQVSVDDFVSAGVTEHLALRHQLANRAARFTRDNFLEALQTIPDVEPESYDSL